VTQDSLTRRLARHLVRPISAQDRARTRLHLLDWLGCVAGALSHTTLQLRAGASREDAFRKLAELAQVDEIRSFTTLIIQSDKLGTSIVATLRVYAGEMREMRRLRAEEKAHRLPVLMSIPLVTCMLPVMIGVMMLPAAIRLVRYIIPALLGG
jgi:tight adherence protein C